MIDITAVMALVMKAIASSGKTPDAYTKSETDTLLSAKADLTDGKVPAAQLPSYVDDVLEYANTAAFPVVGESGKIYVAQDTNKTYRWGGSAYAEISESLALGETASTAYAGDKGKANADAITAIKDGLTIDSFSDVETALSGKADTSSLATVATSGSYNDLTNKPTIPAAQVQANWTQTTTTEPDYIKNKPTLGTASEKDVPSSGNATNSQVVLGSDTRLSDARTPTSHTHTKSEITDFPTLATVATSGSYNDLSNKPTIPDAQVNSNWNATSGVARILNKPTLGAAASRGVDTTATSGSTNLITSDGVYTIVGNINTVLESVL